MHHRKSDVVNDVLNVVAVVSAVVICLHLLTISWQLLAASGSFWLLLAVPGISLQLLAVPGSSWHLGGSHCYLAWPWLGIQVESNQRTA